MHDVRESRATAIFHTLTSGEMSMRYRFACCRLVLGWRRMMDLSGLFYDYVPDDLSLLPRSYDGTGSYFARQFSRCLVIRARGIMNNPQGILWHAHEGENCSLISGQRTRKKKGSRRNSLRVCRIVNWSVRLNTYVSSACISASRD